MRTSLRFLLLHVLPGVVSPLCAQNYGELNINNVRARFYSDGMVGMDPVSYDPNFEVPNGDGTHPLFVANLWMGGLTPGNQLELAAVRYNQVGEDWFPGPLTIDGTASISSSVSNAWDQVWALNTADVAQYQAYCTCLATPGCDAALQFPGYQMPAYFNDWPAIGDVGAGQDLYLAPFIDTNGDGDYNPGDCDAPCGLGDQSLYFIFNDKLAPHTESGGQAIGVEVQTRPFAYDGPTAALSNTVFVEYRIINRGTQTLTGFHVGLFTDFDLGNPDDDLIGSDVGRSLWYVYNGDNDDETTATHQGYGTQPPAFGATILCGLFNDYDGLDWTQDSALVAYNGQGTGDGIADNERQGLMHFGAFGNSGSATGDPSLAAQYYGYMRGLWNDNSQWLYGGTGHISDPNADPNTPTRFLFPSDTDPMGLGTGNVPQTPWSEVSAGLTPGDSRGLGSMGPITLEPGMVNRIVVAFVYARAGSGGPLASVQALQARVDSIRAFADANDFCGGFREDVPCGNSIVQAVAEGTMEDAALVLYPVPARGELNITLPVSMQRATLRMLDATGRLVLTLPAENNSMRKADISTLADGHYSVVAEYAGARCHGRFLKE